MPSTRWIAVIGCVAIAALSGCGADSESGSSASSTSQSAPTVAEDPAEGTDDASTSTYDFSAVSPVVEAFIEENDLNGAGLIVVDRDDGVIHHDHWGDFDEDRISLVASSSKMITAGVLARLDDDGVLDLDAPVADVVEWGSAHPDITPAQLISNSSGLVGLLPDPAYAPHLCQFLPTGTLQECAETIFTAVDGDGETIPPDTEFRYGGAQWQVAGAVAEAASGRSWAGLVDEIYVQPCGLEALGYNNHFIQLPGDLFAYPDDFDGDPTVMEPTENPNMEAGAYVTTGDYGELLLMHLRGGSCGDEQVLSQDVLDRMHGDRIGEVYGGDAVAVEGDGPSVWGYGMGWWVDRETGIIADGGAYGSVPWLDLEDGYGAFLVIESLSVTGDQLAAELRGIIDTAAKGT